MGFADIDFWDRLGDRQSLVHRLDPRAKLVVALFFIITVMSFAKYELLALMPFFFYPVILTTVAGIPVRALLIRVCVISGFAVMIGIFNPLFDQRIIVHLGPVALSAGWISFFSIILRFLLTASAALILLATSGIYGLCLGLERLGVPDVMVTQILLLYRYIFVLVDEAHRIVRARNARSFGRRGHGLGVYAVILGYFLIKTLGRAHHIYNAMKSRGFRGRVYLSDRLCWRWSDSVYTLSCCSLILLARFYNLPLLTMRFLSGQVS